MSREKTCHWKLEIVMTRSIKSGEWECAFGNQDIFHMNSLMVTTIWDPRDWQRDHEIMSD